ncbi:hypothetical protein DSM07_09790 [Oenococcus sp. UCMA 16435]|nr:hypothetical protein DSM07_09790 [Oenococcus sp. UCMA 16435]MDI4584859.1 hypothetical protein [Oenococcus sp. UCMA 14587]
MGSLWDWLYNNWFAQETFWKTVAIIVIFPAACLEIQRFIQFRFRKFDLRIFSADDNNNRHLNSDLISIRKNILIIEILNRNRMSLQIKNTGILFDNKEKLKFSDDQEFELKGGSSIQISFNRNKLIDFAKKNKSSYIKAYVIDGKGREYHSKKILVDKI